MTARELQAEMVKALDGHDKTRIQPALEALRAAAAEHNALARRLHEHFKMWPESQTKPGLARHPIFGSVESCLQHRLGQKREL